MIRNKIIAFLLVLTLISISAVSMSQDVFGQGEVVVTESSLEVVETEAPVEDNNENKGLDLGILARAAVLLDANSGKFLYEQNSHEQLPPASITKIMTMLLVMEAVERGQISLEDEVTISQRAASMGGSQMYMEQGETQTVETLLKGMAIASANDACVACAEYVAGTEQMFIEMMNKRAKELGMKDTNFVNTNGLPAENHYTSAYDIGIMARELLKHEKVFDWLTTWQTTVLVGLESKGQTEFGLTNTNRLIKLYPGANGIKTGFTQEAGYCLAGSATRNDLTLIAVVLNCETTHDRWNETMRLLDYGFATYESAKLAEKGEILGTVDVEKGTPSTVNSIAPEDIKLLVKKGEAGQITSSAIIFDRLKAPINAGDQIGELIVYKDGAEIDRYPLVAEQSVDKAGIFEIYLRMLKTLI
ncbi:MAG: D-alanyl-D-alanine carboxypeptidase [Clostridiales bacterium]|nr:D-alanyl-D-alanine carboxypeptidase [Clostridiales bacterium]